MRFLDILVVFRLDIGQVSFNLTENAFATRQLALLATSIAFFDSLARLCAAGRVFRLFDFLNFFFAFPVFSFSFLFGAPSTGLACG